ncbi:uncharacterized protein L203_101704 [Cryptococcus depauperatus CBS 7841]|uniref:Uncharacterized protein n=1 Tax=Cryptococcus depauperatus CBS 7841 TaxID=1295531 RepID=A0A1E3HPU8_9TREE|nr:hypothetical protein L203_06245 [Cryptococcus depauperatus CBS 7841]
MLSFVKHLFNNRKYGQSLGDTSYASSIPLYDVDRPFSANYYNDPFAKSPVVTVKADCSKVYEGYQRTPSTDDYEADLIALPRPMFMRNNKCHSSPSGMPTDPRHSAKLSSKLGGPRSSCFHKVANSDRAMGNTRSAPCTTAAVPELSHTIRHELSEISTLIPLMDDPELAASTVNYLHSICETIRGKRTNNTSQPNDTVKSIKYLQVPQIKVNNAEPSEPDRSHNTIKDFKEFGWLVDYIGDGICRPRSFPPSSLSSKSSHVDSDKIKAMEMLFYSARQTLIKADTAGHTSLKNAQLADNVDSNPDIIDKLQELFDFFQQDGLLLDGSTSFSNHDSAYQGIYQGIQQDNTNSQYGPNGGLSTQFGRLDVPVSSTNTVCMPSSVTSQMKKKFQHLDYSNSMLMSQLPFKDSMAQCKDNKNDKQKICEGRNIDSEIEDDRVELSEADITAVTLDSDTTPLNQHMSQHNHRRQRPPVPIRSIRLSRWPSSVDPKYLFKKTEWTPVKMDVAPSSFSHVHCKCVHHDPRDEVEFELEKLYSRESSFRTKKSRGPAICFVLGFIFPFFWVIGGWFLLPPQPRPTPRHSRSRSSAPIDFETGISFIPSIRHQEFDKISVTTTNTTGLWYTHSDPMIKANRSAALIGIPSLFLVSMLLIILFTVVKS